MIIYLNKAFETYEDEQNNLSAQNNKKSVFGNTSKVLVNTNHKFWSSLMKKTKK